MLDLSRGSDEMPTLSTLALSIILFDLFVVQTDLFLVQTDFLVVLGRPSICDNRQKQSQASAHLSQSLHLRLIVSIVRNK